MPLDGIGADLHLLATSEDSIAFAFASPKGLRWVGAASLARAPEEALSILEGFASMRLAGRTDARRLREVVPNLARELAAPLALSPAAPFAPRQAGPRAGSIDLANSYGLLLALTFGRCDAAQLAQAAAWSEAFGNGEIRLSFTRGLLLHGLAATDAAALINEASRLGFITDAGDPSLSVQACPGRPACAGARTATPADALRIADAADALLRKEATIHVSGCPKGCAHPSVADLTFVGRENGTYGVVIRGSSGDATSITASLEEIMTRLSSLKDPQDLRCAFEETAP
jgi:precorrin-3B synthase